MWLGRAVGFHTMFLLDLVSVFLHLAAFRRLMVSWAGCVFVRLCMPVWSVPLAPSFAILTYLVSIVSRPMLTLRGWCGLYGFLTYLFTIPLFPHAPWPSHTLLLFCFFFLVSVVMYLTVLRAYEGMEE